MSEDSKLFSLRKASYGSGSTGADMLMLTVVSWVIYYYAPPASSDLTPLVPLGVAGFAMFAGRIVDGAASLFIGHWSDIVRTRWGRRLPFLIFGAPPLLLSFIFIWRPPLAEVSIWNFVYLTVLLVSFWFFYTVYICPWVSLLPQMARDEQERTDLGIWRSIGTLGAMALFTALVPILINSFGYETMGLIIAAIGLPLVYAPALGISEDEKWKKCETGEDTGLSFKNALKETLTTKPFLIFIAAVFVYYSLYNTLLMLAPYIVTVLTQNSETIVTAVLGSTLLSTVANLAIVRKLTTDWGPKKMFLTAFLFSVVVMFLFSIVGLFDFIPALPLTIIAAISFGFPLAVFFAVEPVLYSEIVDYDEEKTGHRRGGMFSGTRGITTKISIGVTFFLSTVVMEYFGYSVENPLGIRIVALSLAALAIIGYLIFRKYPLGEA